MGLLGHGRSVMVCNPEGKLCIKAFFCTDFQAVPGQILPWIITRWPMGGFLQGDPRLSGAGDSMRVAGLGHWAHHPPRVGPVFHHTYAGATDEPRWSDL